MANVENVEEMVGTREVEVAVAATESGGVLATESGGAVATESGGAATTDDATAGNECPYTIDVRHVEEMVRTTREAADGDRVRRGRDGDETGDEIGGHMDETADKTAATAGDEQDGASGGVMYMDEGELELDEDEIAVLEGQRLVAEFR